ncbi:two-component sensor histidine kinase, partial [Streptomyces lydicamycinicus]
MSFSAPPVTQNRPARSLFAGPEECGWRLWRAVGEAVAAGALVLLVCRGGEAVSYLRLEGGAVALGLIGVAVALVLVRRRFPVAGVVGLAALMGVVPAVAPLTAVVAYTAARQI